MWQALRLWTLFWDYVWSDRDTLFYFNAVANGERKLQATYNALRKVQE